MIEWLPVASQASTLLLLPVAVLIYRLNVQIEKLRTEMYKDFVTKEDYKSFHLKQGAD